MGIKGFNAWYEFLKSYNFFTHIVFQFVIFVIYYLTSSEERHGYGRGGGLSDHTADLYISKRDQRTEKTYRQKDINGYIIKM